MKAVYIAEFGDIAGLALSDVPEPSSVKAGEVLVRVHAAGLNRADLLQLRGLYPPPAGFSPNIPGLEFAGEIAAIGDQVVDRKVGDRVFGITSGEAQAEFLKIDPTLLARIPDSLTFVEAATVPEAFITAHDAVLTQGELTKGETILIHAVGSGVGLAALQIAKAVGAHVLGTSRTAKKLERCREFGLDTPIALGDGGDFAQIVKKATGGRGADVILDLVGAAYFAANLASLSVKGRLLLVGLTSGAVAEFDMRVALQKRATIIGTVLRSRTTNEKADAVTAFVKDVVPLIESGKIKPNLDRVFDAADVRSGYEYLGSNESFGKVVLKF